MCISCLQQTLQIWGTSDEKVSQKVLQRLLSSCAYQVLLQVSSGLQALHSLNSWQQGVFPPSESQIYTCSTSVKTSMWWCRPGRMLPMGVEGSYVQKASSCRLCVQSKGNDLCTYITSVTVAQARRKGRPSRSQITVSSCAQCDPMHVWVVRATKHAAFDEEKEEQL